MKLDPGSISGNVYTNSYFGFSVQFPKGWTVLKTIEAKALIERSEVQIAKDDPTLKATTQKARTSTIPLLTVAANTSGMTGLIEKRFGILTDDYSNQRGRVTAERVMKWMVFTTRARKLPIKYLSSPQEVTFGGKKLWKVSWTETTGGLVRYAIQYLMVEKQHDVQFILVSSDEAGLADLEPIMQTLKFFPLPEYN